MKSKRVLHWTYWKLNGSELFLMLIFKNPLFKEIQWKEQESLLFSRWRNIQHIKMIMNNYWLLHTLSLPAFPKYSHRSVPFWWWGKQSPKGWSHHPKAGNQWVSLQVPCLKFLQNMIGECPVLANRALRIPLKSRNSRAMPPLKVPRWAHSLKKGLPQTLMQLSDFQVPFHLVTRTHGSLKGTFWTAYAQEAQGSGVRGHDWFRHAFLF